MKLGKLLATGKSIMNGRTDVSYRSSKQIYLPKFGSPKNPFKPESAESAEITPPSAATELRASASGFQTIAREVTGTARLAGGAATAFSGAISNAAAVSVAGATETPRPAHRDARETAIGSQVNRSNTFTAPKHSFSAAKSSADNSPAAKPQSAVAAVQSARSRLSKFNPLSILRDALPSGKAKDSAKNAKSLKVIPTQTELSLDTVKVVHNDLSDVDVEVVPIKSRSTVPELPAPKKSWEFVGERLFGVEAT